MRTLAFSVMLLAALLVLPLAAARPDLPDVDPHRVTVGPCTVGWSPYWPGETVGVRCEVAGQTVAASQGTCALGNYVFVRAGPVSVLVPCDLSDATSPLLA